MQPTDDGALLRQFAENNSDEAFAALVTRHINLVYSVALRRAGNPHAAEEITQAVFIILAKKAAQLRHDRALGSWLFRTTRLTANNFIRSEARRHRREEEAYMQSVVEGGSGAPPPQAPEIWPEIAPLLDDAVANLRERDRRAILLRFYEGRNLREVGAVLGASEDAAEKRVNRALEKLRKFFTKRGVTLSSVAIAGTISAHSVQAAPVALAKSVTVTAIAKGSIAAATTLTLVKGTMKTMTWLKIKFAVYAVATVMLAGGVTTVALSGDGHERAKDLASSTFQIRLVLNAVSADSVTLDRLITNSESGKVSQETVRVQKKVLLDKSAIESASVATNSFIGHPNDIVINFTLTPKGKQQFAKVTREHIGQRLAIIVDGKLISAPVIRSEITSGKGQISGNFTLGEATRLAAILNRPAGD